VLYESSQKARDALVQLVGTFGSWYNNHVFGATNASSFTDATDAERKDQIEELVPGCADFDGALEQCRADQKRALERRTALKQEITRDQSVLQAAEQSIEAARAVAGAVLPDFDEDGCRRRLARLQQLREGLRDQIVDVLNRLGQEQMPSKPVVSYTSISEMERDLQQLAGHCPLCRQEVPPSYLDQMLSNLAAQRAALDRQSAELGEVYARELHDYVERSGELRAVYQGLRADAELYDEAKTKMTGELAQRQQQQATAERARASIAASEKHATMARMRISDLEDRLAQVEGEITELEACERVLGIKGLRSHLFERVLQSMESLVNAQLAGCWPGVTVKLKTTRETRRSVREEISIELEGAQPLPLLSRGQRMRLDWAFFLARRALARAAGVPVMPYVVADEPFDGISVDGLDAVGSQLRELGRDALVVVITHQERVAGVGSWDQVIEMA
jgi:DNA repair exonuclease SbcCD ATPase subunit